jgi:hypothetical protein
VAEREPIRPKQKRRLVGKIGIVLYALLMTFLQSHYITAQLYPESEYFFGVWLNVSDAEVLSGLLLALCANIGLLLSPFLSAPGRAVRLAMLVSLAFGAILATISLVHIFSIYAFYPFWPKELDPNLPQGESFDHIYMKMFIESLSIYAMDLFAIYLYLTRLKHLYVFRKRELREQPTDTGNGEDTAA